MAPQPAQPSHDPPHPDTAPPSRRLRAMRRTASATRTATAAPSASVPAPATPSSSARPTPRTANAAAQATASCPNTMPSAHLPPSSRLTDAMAATHGVYSRQNTSKPSAASGVMAATRLAVLPNSTDNVDTTLSFAITPVTSAVEMRQSSKPSGANTGAIQPATTASMLSCESATTFSPKSNVCKNQMTIVAKKMMVNARSRKSFAFSHSICATLRALGMR